MVDGGLVPGMPPLSGSATPDPPSAPLPIHGTGMGMGRGYGYPVDVSRRLPHPPPHPRPWGGFLPRPFCIPLRVFSSNLPLPLIIPRCSGPNPGAPLRKPRFFFCDRRDSQRDCCLFSFPFFLDHFPPGATSLHSRVSLSHRPVSVPAPAAPPAGLSTPPRQGLTIPGISGVGRDGSTTLPSPKSGQLLIVRRNPDF